MSLEASGDRHALAVSLAQRPAVERLLVGVVEFEAARPIAPVDDDLDSNVLRPLPAVLVPAAGVGVKVAPQQLRCRHRQRDQVAPVDRDARPLR